MGLLKLIFTWIILCRCAARASLPPLSWLRGIDLSKAPIQSAKTIGHAGNLNDCAQLVERLRGFNGFLLTDANECIALDINLDEDLEEGEDVVYILGQPWDCDYPYYYKLTAQKWTPASWEAAHANSPKYVAKTSTIGMTTAATTTTTTTTTTTITATTTTETTKSTIGNIILVIGGRNETDTTVPADLVSMMDNQDQACQSRVDIDTDNARYMTGGFVDGSPVVCGGYRFAAEEEQIASKQCDILSPKGKYKNRQVPMSFARGQAASVVLDGGQTLWITGGQPQWNSKKQFLKTTEYLSPASSKTEPGPDLKEEIKGHCLIKINDTSVLLIGGSTKAMEKGKNGYYIDPKTGNRTKVRPINNGRYGHVCGQVASGSGGKMIEVVVGGFMRLNNRQLTKSNSRQTTELLDVINNKKTWILGPMLEMEDPKRASALTTPEGSFLVIGGGSEIKGNRDIFELSCQGSVQSCLWTKRDQELASARFAHVAMIVPGKFARCQD